MRARTLIVGTLMACGARTPLPAPTTMDASTPPECVPQEISTRYDATWVFGNGCRADWNAADDVTFSASQIHFTGIEGTIAAADPTTGALFAVSDGIDLYDGDGHKQNGTPLGANVSTSQAAAFIGKPPSSSSGDKGAFFIVTDSANDGEGSGLFVTMLDCGSVKPTAPPLPIAGTAEFTEALVTLRNANGHDRWVLSSSPDGMEVIAVTSAGFSKSTTTPYGGALVGVIPAQRAFIAFARDRKTFAMTAEHRGLLMGTFDDATGAISGITGLSVPSTASLYSVAFSPDGTKLYASEWEGNYYQIDLAAGNATSLLGAGTGALRLAIDDKIYLAQDGKAQLTVIANPNDSVLNLQIGTVGLPSGCTCWFGFPGVGDL